MLVRSELNFKIMIIQLKKMIDQMSIGRITIQV